MSPTTSWRLLTQALETAPAFQMTEDVARRTAFIAVKEKATLEGPASVSRFGALTARVTVALLLVAMLLVAPLTRAHAVVPLTVEMLFAAEFVALPTTSTRR